MSRPSSYSPELRHLVRMVAESKASYGSEFQAIKSIASKPGFGSPEKWSAGLRSMLGRDDDDDLGGVLAHRGSFFGKWRRGTLSHSVVRPPRTVRMVER
jgi:hypothetical protein